jgi:hypothetical protein
LASLCSNPRVGLIIDDGEQPNGGPLGVVGLAMIPPCGKQEKT